MHDEESDIMIYRTIQEKLNILFKNIDVDANVKKIGTCEIEKEDYYSKCFAGTPSVVTNKGCLELQNTNIDLVQIIQKG